MKLRIIVVSAQLLFSAFIASISLAPAYFISYLIKEKFEINKALLMIIFLVLAVLFLIVARKIFGKVSLFFRRENEKFMLGRKKEIKTQSFSETDKKE